MHSASSTSIDSTSNSSPDATHIDRRVPHAGHMNTGSAISHSLSHTAQQARRDQLLLEPRTRTPSPETKPK